MTNIDYKLAKEIGATHYSDEKYWRSGKNNCAAIFYDGNWFDIDGLVDPNGECKEVWDYCKIDLSKAEAAERDNAIERMTDLHAAHQWDAKDFAAALYDAGYRLQEGE